MHHAYSLPSILPMHHAYSFPGIPPMHHAYSFPGILPMHHAFSFPSILPLQYIDTYSRFGPCLDRMPSVSQLYRHRALNKHHPVNSIYIDGRGNDRYDPAFSALLHLLAKESIHAKNPIKSLTIVDLDWRRLVDRSTCNAAFRSFSGIIYLRVKNIRCRVDELRSLILSFPNLAILDLQGVVFDEQERLTQPDGEQQYPKLSRLTITLDDNAVSVLDLFRTIVSPGQIYHLELKGADKIPGTVEVMHRIVSLSKAALSLGIGHINMGYFGYVRMPGPILQIAGLNNLTLTIALSFSYNYILAVRWWTEVFKALPAENNLRRLTIRLSGSWADAGLAIEGRLYNDWRALDGALCNPSVHLDSFVLETQMSDPENTGFKVQVWMENEGLRGVFKTYDAKQRFEFRNNWP
ncbi:uncharacterized protein BT62DRAFT_1040801 [Guyanagaster necrorhizus]|uniref:Uncharacterized protein n=1 Tax=Guyanagaster necrorhizus TaxID=856835 RepID=A0A9P8ANX8_9AGAR|nr:uncharacterized protein BT62DRAFT_1040801 [Guyanagaster necrorhizus MCA 3950]KAG7442339.1 hypothetical protein BT62DRAFT_1040801 [Guyanagaster necrorhizus MCA 3950]